MFRLPVIWIGKILLLVTKWRGGGSSLPGYVVERLYPNFIHSIRPHYEQVVIVTGTNGKTTTTKLLQEILRCKYDIVVHNEAGSNMTRGVISATLAAMSWSGELTADIGLFEVDEGFAPVIARALEPDLCILLNLHRDQLDRYGEVERTKQLLAEATTHSKQTIINIDDPKLRVIMSSASSPITVGAAEHIREQVPSDEALHSVRQTRTVEGDRQSSIQILIEDVEVENETQLITIREDKEVRQLRMRIPGVFNAYNAAMAYAGAVALGLDRKIASEAIYRVEPAFGRAEQIEVDGKTLQLFLVKNPSGFNQAIVNFLDKKPLPTLILINDNYADGRDVSWLWDVAIENWQHAPELIMTGGVRGYDMALRLQYAEIPAETELDMEQALERFLENIPEGGSGYVVPTYTAMLAVRKLIHKQAKESS